MKILSAYQNKPRLKDGVFLAVWVALAVFLFYKCRYGIGNFDESFYLTVPCRLYQGDGLFVDEWHLSQMAGVLTLPLVSFYLNIMGGNDGLVLFMRQMCTLIQCLIALVSYLRLRRYSWLGAVCASVGFALYIPFGIMALSYNSMAIMALVLVGLLLLPGGKERKSFYVLAGLCFAAAVLCCPYLAAVYVLYLLSVAGVAVYRQVRKCASPDALSPWTWKGALLITAGAGAAAVAFLIFVLSRGSVSDVLKAFEQIMNDPEHPSRSVLYYAKSYVRSLLKAHKYGAIRYGVLFVLFALCLVDKKRHTRRLLHFCPAAVLVGWMMAEHYAGQYINVLMWSVNMLAPFLLLLSRRKICGKLFVLFWVPGMLYSFCLHMASNQMILAICSAASVAAFGSLMMLGIFAGELIASDEKKCAKVLGTGFACCLLLLQLVSQTHLRYTTVFWEIGGMAAQTEKIPDGFERGLYVSQNQYQQYYGARKALAPLKELGGDKVLFLSEATWYYLLEDYEYATYSAWLSGVSDHTVDRLVAYYELNPEKLPDVVWAGKAREEYARKLCDALGYDFQYAAGGIVLTRPS